MRNALAAFIIMTLLPAIAPAAGELTLVPPGSTWKYHAAGAPPGNWFQPAFNDSNWPSGHAQLGYGEGDEQTILFSNPTNAPPTVYFRYSFARSNSPVMISGTVRLVADDGVVVYFNGLEIGRKNLPAGALSHFTPAVNNIEAGETNLIQFGILGHRFSTNNTLAVAVHQHPAGRHDCSFDLQLLGNIPVELPEVTITAPTNGAVLDPEPFTIQTQTSDRVGHITRVEFYTNGVLMGETAQEPFSFVLQTPDLGRYQILARAYNNFFYRNDSPPIYVQLGNLTALSLVRGPYLQSGTPHSVIIRWRTDWFCESVVRFGTNLSLASSVNSGTPRLDHEIKLTGLQPNTTYFYSIGTPTRTFAQGSQYYFRTSPTNSQPVRVWVIGDSGTSDIHAERVRDAYQDSTSGHTDVWLMLGDNAYGAGYDYEYQTAVFEMYPDLLRNTVLWPTLGNHDAGDAQPGRFAPYLDIFTLPKNGEAGGLASGTELYYSFDYAHVHFICLDSYISDRAPNAPMASWLRQDLAATDKDWIIAYWHHPPYSMGGHPSDGESYLIEMRENIVPILEEYGVDLVLAGHSHVYERSFFLNGHYGYSWQLQPSMILDSGLGRPEQPYRKPAGGLGAHRGAVYTVCGCSGEGGTDTFDHHPAIAVPLGGYGSMVLEINGLELQARFLRPSLAIDDWFVIDKSAPANIQPQLNISRGTNGPLISWPTSLPAFDLFRADQSPMGPWQTFSIPARTLGRRNLVELQNTNEKSFFRLQSRP